MAVGYNPRTVTDGLVLHLDPANTKSYNTKNLFENPTDILSWMGTAITSTHNGSVSRDTTVSSPVGNSPMKMVCTGTSAYIQTWGNSASSYLISSASQGETFTVSVWAKSASGTTLADCEIFIFDANSSGSWNSSDNTTYSKGTFTVTDTWQRFSFTRTTTWSSTANIQVRVDGPQNGTGTLWWDGMQVERSSTATNFSSGSSTILDLSGKGNNGTISGATHNSGVGGYFDFDGSNDYVSHSNDSFVSNGGATLECWFSADTGSADRSLINHSGFSYFNILRSSNNKLRLEYKSTSANNTQLFSSSTIFIGNSSWYHVVGVVDNTGARIYINGELDASNSTPQNLGTVSSTLYIGGYSSSSTYRFDGKIAVAKRYDKPLTASEVKQNFNALRGRFGI